MSIFLKLFNRKINIKVRKLDSEQRISFLANKLIKELIEKGYDLRGLGTSGTIPNYLSFSISVNYRENDNSLYVGSINRAWQVEDKCTEKYPAKGDSDA